ncbi:hypothetical protein Fmac_030077 [Flemingia macrophylla]|uniref:Uncharacterized protein n=1 Tax=Flemingia macrophylla TaxID=520843 RepID=A0ABD1LCR1_9FABA
MWGTIIDRPTTKANSYFNFFLQFDWVLEDIDSTFLLLSLCPRRRHLVLLVVNAPTANTVAAADHDIALLAAMATNVAQADVSVKADECYGLTREVAEDPLAIITAYQVFEKVEFSLGKSILVPGGGEVPNCCPPRMSWSKECSGLYFLNE